MPLRLLSLVLCILATAVSAQTTYNGRGNSDMVGDQAVSTGQMTLSDDAVDLTVDLVVRTGFNFINENVVLYIDTKSGGFADNSGFTDVVDAPRIAASGRSGSGQLAPLTFPAGFTADYAVVFENGQTTVFELMAGTTHLVLSSQSQTKVIDNTKLPEEATVTSVIPLSLINSPQDIVFVAAYRYRDGSLTDESYTETINGGDPGFNAYTFTQTATYTTSALLPVSLRRFDAAATAKGVELVWETASEQDNAGFAVERSVDGDSWTELAFVTGAGDTQTTVAYDYTDDAKGAGTRYYRLRQLDYDGTATYSPVRTVDAWSIRGTPEVALVGAHPVSQHADFRNGSGKVQAASLYDVTGRKVAGFEIAAGETYRLDVGQLVAGTYVLRVGAKSTRLVVQ